MGKTMQIKSVTLPPAIFMERIFCSLWGSGKGEPFREEKDKKDNKSYHKDEGGMM
ncbi:MAG: hypothetical protein Q4D60_08820 [Eubacteriales bacterium]|nr:hypothetical protein [Eubacteriales bacterium]